MDSTRRRRQKDRRLLSQLDEFDGHLTVVQDNHNTQVRSEARLTGKIWLLLIQITQPQLMAAKWICEHLRETLFKKYSMK